MTVSDDGVRRKPRLADDVRAELAAEAWRLSDMHGMSVRSIHARFVKQGHELSHVTVWRMLKEAYEQAEFLDLIGPAETRAGAVGRIQTAIEKVFAAIDAGEVDLAKGIAQYVGLERMLIQLTGAAMPTRVEVHSDPDRAVPNMAMLTALREARQHAEKMQDMEENDGLDG